VNIGKSITVCLDDRGMMKKKLAERLDITPQTVSALMKSEHCSSKILIALANEFEMTVAEFIALGE